MFSWQEQYLTSELRSLVRYCSCHSNIKFISSHHRIISSMYNTTQCNTLYNVVSWKFKLAWGENCSKNRKIRAKIDSTIYGRWRLHVMCSFGGNVCARSSGIKSVSGNDSLLDLLGLKPTTRSTTSLRESVSTSESDEVTCYSTATRIAHPSSRTTAYRSCPVQPSQCLCTPGSAVPFAPCHSPLFSSPWGRYVFPWGVGEG